ncbi:MAG: hypothetical protein RQ856_06840 [Candidatus Izemoplasmatales bacterium]|nr:hypothetical protein [Candidatus Izemoplasmatales bacterium]
MFQINKKKRLLLGGVALITIWVFATCGIFTFNYVLNEIDKTGVYSAENLSRDLIDSTIPAAIAVLIPILFLLLFKKPKQA